MIYISGRLVAGNMYITQEHLAVCHGNVSMAEAHRSDAQAADLRPGELKPGIKGVENDIVVASTAINRNGAIPTVGVLVDPALTRLPRHAYTAMVSRRRAQLERSGT